MLAPEALMYATLSYDVSAGQQPIEDVRQALLELFKERETCDLLSDTFICDVATTADYLAVARQLNKIGRDFPDQFQFVFTLHRTGDALRSNGAFSKAKANAIIDPGDDA
jgi:hypothetical protein